MNNLTPMMQQYLDIKKQYNDCILLYRLGDFYEMFFEDALRASKDLEITLTGRDCGLAERAPMCGVPFHSITGYIVKLVNKGYKVAICEQMEDPALAKGIVKREVTRIVTPGTITEFLALDEKKNNYIVSVYKDRMFFGLSSADVSTGEFHTTSFSWGNTINKLLDEIARFYPSEIVCNKAFAEDPLLKTALNQRFSIIPEQLDDIYFDLSESIKKIDQYFPENKSSTLSGSLMQNSSGALLHYLENTQKLKLSHINTLHVYNPDEYLVIDAASRRNLELTETMRDKSKKGSLLWVLDNTVTAMGGRKLRKWLEQPLKNVMQINERLDSVESIKNAFIERNELIALLKKVYDIERLLSKVVLNNANCRDLNSLKNSLYQLAPIRIILSKFSCSLLSYVYGQIDELNDVLLLLEHSIADDPPVSVKEGGIIKDGYNHELDELRRATREGKNWIAAFEASEKEKSGIKNLRTGFNKVFGYYIEITRSNLQMVPDNYIRKQTLANCERYITSELKEIEDKILGAEEKIVTLEFDIFTTIIMKIKEQAERIKTTAEAISVADALCSFAQAAFEGAYCKPVINDSDIIDINEGRHPVVEKIIGRNNFIPNDTYLDMNDDRLLIITGPNMAGKSTFIRQVALIILMAQAGSFIPAEKASIGIVDRIFTRVGASDDLATGQSTFMVEMTEVANILNNATHRSLLILDELGRGTSTFDGLSIAWSVIEYLGDKEAMGQRTLFATHYHELTELEGNIAGIKNYCISVKEEGEEITFLRRIIRGGADGSYGIHVAKLAGVPAAVIERAKDILAELENADISKKKFNHRKARQPIEGQLDLFTASMKNQAKLDVINELANLDLNAVSPIEALNKLYLLQMKAKKG